MFILRKHFVLKSNEKEKDKITNWFWLKNTNIAWPTLRIRRDVSEPQVKKWLLTD